MAAHNSLRNDSSVAAPDVPLDSPADSRLGSGKDEDWVILNLGCGTKTSPRCINLDRSVAIRLALNPISRMILPLFLDKEQTRKLQRLDNVKQCDLKKGIPQADSSVDAAYHSHVLEHIDRQWVLPFLLEIKRVLKPGAVHRIVVPDLERLAKAYLHDLMGPGSKDWRDHDHKIESMIEQSVRRQSAAVRNYGPFRRKLETIVFGDARKRGETHQWMYDRITLAGILAEAGFQNISQVDYGTSRIPNWPAIGLDLDCNGLGEYKPESIYFECTK